MQMNIGAHSKARLMGTFAHWSVARDYAEPMYNYLVHGFSPGSFFTALLANDFARAVQCSHPANTIPALKNLVGWVLDYIPTEARGSNEAVEQWLSKTNEERYTILAEHHLIFSQEDEMLKTIKGERAVEPVLY